MMPTDATDTVSLKDLTAILDRRKRLILTVFVLVVAGVAGGTLLTPKQYETRMKVLVKNERADMIVSPDSNGSSGYHGEVSEAEINSEIELLTSNNLLQQIVEKCGLDRLREVAAPLPAEGQAVAMERAVKRLGRDLKVSPVRKANIILVEYADTNPHRAVAVLSQLADLYLEEHLRVHGTPGTYEFFKGQASRYQQELQDAESRLAAFRRTENIDMLAEQKNVLLQKATESEAALLQSEAAAGEYAQKIAGTRRQLAAAQPRVVTQTRTLSNQYSVDHLNSMLAELRNRRTGLLAKFRPEDRMVQEVDQEIANTQAALDEAVKMTGVDQATDINPLHQALAIDLAKQETELSGIDSRRQVLAGQTAAYRGQLTKLGGATAAFDDLVRTQKEAEDNYLLYSKKTEEARIAESLDRQKIANVAIAETPIEPHVPFKPNVPLNLALGVFMAGFLSLGAGFSAEYLQGDAVQQPEELEALTGLPVVAASYGD
jgi:uncharacterized protein involved in exopolysaccharide biosynthesis